MGLAEQGAQTPTPRRQLCPQSRRTRDEVPSFLAAVPSESVLAALPKLQARGSHMQRARMGSALPLLAQPGSIDPIDESVGLLRTEATFILVIHDRPWPRHRILPRRVFCHTVSHLRLIRSTAHVKDHCQ